MPINKVVLAEIDQVLQRRTTGLGRAHDLAARANVGPSTLKKVREMADQWSQSPPDDQHAREACGPKLWDSIVRLAKACEAEPETWLLAFGVDEAGVRGAIAAATRRVRSARVKRPAGGPDLVAQIERAAVNRHAPPTIAVGLLHWEPFTTLPLPGWPAPSGPERAPPPFASSIGAWWVRKSIGAVAPEVRDFTFERVERVDELFRGLGVRGGQRRWDVAVGLFDMPQRRRTGVWFSSIPGFRVKLGAVYFSPSPAPSVPPWEQIASPDRARPECIHHVVTVHEEASWIFLRGATQYPADRIHEAESLEIHRLLQACARVAAELRDRADASGAQDEAARSFVLVSDEETVLRVLRGFNIVRHAVAAPEGPRIAIELGPVGSGAGEVEATPELMAFSTYSARELPDEHNTRPRFQATLCFAPGEERLYRLVRRAKLDELFGSAVEDTGRLLGDFYAEAARSSGAFRLVREGGTLTWRKTAEDPRSIWSPRQGFNRHYLRRRRLRIAFSKHLVRRLREIVEQQGEFSSWSDELEQRAFSSKDGLTHAESGPVAPLRSREIAAEIADWLLPEPWKTASGRAPGR